MLWEVEIRPLGLDGERERVCDEFDLLTHSQRGADWVSSSSRGFLLEGEIDRAAAEQLMKDLLADLVVEEASVFEVGHTSGTYSFTVLLKPGVMDPVAESVLGAAADLGVPLKAVRTFRRYFGPENIPSADQNLLFRKVLANDAIEQVILGPLKPEHLALGKPYAFKKTIVPLRNLGDDELVKLSKEGQLALNLDEMKTVQAHFKEQDRDPTDVELETVAQTWSEHCSHKTLKGTIDYTEINGGQRKTIRYGNLLKETIFGATQELRKRFGADDWCVSVFADNAGVVTFDENFHACIKVETHNHPSAIEPYGGANTGLGGVIRDPLGTGLGAKPICNTDVFCFANPDFPPDDLPTGVIHPRRTMIGVVSGVRDYGNRMGIPTVNGAIVFDERYLANPLVFCGTLGIIPVDKVEKASKPGDYIVAVGGRTGRDGIHGATFSSLELTDESETVSGGAVQIGNAIAEKKVLDVILQARDLGLYSAITDCGAGGFSSAVGEMGADLGASVQLEKCPLKYAGLSYTEIWISESQERMVLAVPPKNWPELQALCAGEGVEAAIIGTFENTGRLKLSYQGEPVGDVAMHFLHDGRPTTAKVAEYEVKSATPATGGTAMPPADALLKILGSYSVCSKEWVIRQYDHEVQGGSVIKPLTGVMNDGPSDASVVMPVLGSMKGLAVACGLNPRYGDLDTYHMAATAIDEAVRNVVAVGGNPARTAILDNFCWGNVNDPAILGSLVRTSEACRDVALAFGTPFVSGKDSLNNQYTSANRKISIPGTLLVTAMAHVDDVRQCVTMDLKETGNELYLVGTTKDELGGSHYHLITGQTGGQVPTVDVSTAPKIFKAMHSAITGGLIRSCHDLSEGGFAVSIAEMAFAGKIGADITELTTAAPGIDDTARLFSESATRFVIEVKPANGAALKKMFDGLPLAKVGTTVKEPRLRIAGADGEWLVWAKLDSLKEAWQKPLRW
ncbi:phosphoribosylformylglycinamidine synthase subunit PurL [Zavarzinella formosa]|uniref:phosphoribosylformylglycinamidine synthase subunit PurL n=1 Tax=Zavarzinella formosa TaxID=360055 RepID=UPI0002E503FD|nr:phosphoribosylformylglycinamidine synthase subunit PurL [Zavarzinella formosa]